MKITKEMIEAKKAQALQDAIDAEKRNPIVCSNTYATYELDSKGNSTGKIELVEKKTKQYCYSTNKNQPLF